MSSLKEMRDELRRMRKETSKPISKMRKGDVAAEIQRMREMREETAPVAATRGTVNKKVAPATESIKKAKESEFPVKPSKATVKMEEPKATPKPRISKSVLRRMVDELTSDEE